MARQRTNQLIAAPYYTWRLTRRSGVWYADGRTNAINLGRHSLGTRDEAIAKRNLIEVDQTCAEAQGRANPKAVSEPSQRELVLEEGRQLYLENAARTAVTGGIRKSSQKRYRAIFDKFLSYAGHLGIQTWNGVNESVIQNYLGSLETANYAYATLYLEGTTLKQAIGWMVQKGHLPKGMKIDLRLKKPYGTTTHCWTHEEFKSIVTFCQSHDDLLWLAGIVIALGSTGLRISELANLKWSDLNHISGMLHLNDESTRGSLSGRPPGGRTLKNGRSRCLPINVELQSVFANLSRSKDGFVFHGPLGGRIKPDTLRNILIRKVLAPLSQVLGTKQTARFLDGRLHSFRHYFCSLCANSGVPQQVVMQWLGHRASAMVQHYYHLHDYEAKRQMDRVHLRITDGTLPTAKGVFQTGDEGERENSTR